MTSAIGVVGRAPGAKGALGLGIAAATLLALLKLAAAGTGAAPLGWAQQGAPAASGQALVSYGKLPLAFVPNAGQIDARVRYHAQAADASFSFTRTAAVLAFTRERKGHVLRLGFVGADPGVDIVGRRRRPGTVNYLLGSEQARWRSGVPTYGEVVYRDLWPGIDLAFRGERGTLKYEFRVAAGANPADIRLAYRGAEGLSLDRAGNLVVQTSLGPLSDSRPLSYQRIGGRRVAVESRYALAGDSYGFALGSYDRSRRLVVDPGLVYSTYLGGSRDDQGNAVAVDAAGSAYVVGTTGSSFTTTNTFPTTAGAFDPTFNGHSDVFVTKLNPAGSELVYSTYLGGSQSENGYAIAVDAAGNAYVTGNTISANFPTTAGALDTALTGVSDAFVAKLDATGSILAYSTYLGGSSNEEGHAIAVDSGGNAHVTGLTLSSNFPTTAGAFDTSFNFGFLGDAFVTKVEASGSTLAYSTYLGGGGTERGTGIALDAVGNAYVSGFTDSTNFPTTIGAYDRTHNGREDAFVTKLNPAGSAPLVYSTYVGGSLQEIGWGMAIDVEGSVYVTGHTNSANFPTAGAFDATLNGLMDAFVLKLNSSGSALTYSTYLGGSSGNLLEQGLGVAVDGEGSAVVTGGTRATDFPTTPDAIAVSSSGVGTLFVTKLDAAGSALRYSTYLPGADASSVVPGSGGIAVDAAGAAYVTGIAVGPPFTPTAGAFDTSNDGGVSAFVTKLDIGRPPVPAVVTLTPATDANPVGTTHTVTATVFDADGNRLENIVVRFSVTGSVTASGQCTTAASGECDFAYQGPDFPGADLIVAFADTDADGVHDADEPAGEASKSWVLPTSTPGQASGGGNFQVGDDRVAFGFSARSGENGARGSCRIVDRVADVMVQCTDVTAFAISDNEVTVYGNALVNGIPTTYRIDAADNASRGRGADTFSIQTASGYTRFGTLAGGNVRVG